MNSHKSFSCVLPVRVEGAARIVRFIVLSIIKFDDVRLNDQLKQSREHICAEVTSEGLHNSKELR
jgi:hypothetical protein